MLLLWAVPVNVRYAHANVRQRTALSGYELRSQAIIFVGTLRVTMADVYRMKNHGSEFIINHNAGGTVGVYKTEREARQGMEDCRRDDLILKVARALVEKAVSALMRAQHINRETAHDWIREAAG
jgi:hypothetical protein